MSSGTEGLGSLIVNRRRPRKTRIGSTIECPLCHRKFLCVNGHEKYCHDEECVRTRERKRKAYERARARRLRHERGPLGR